MSTVPHTRAVLTVDSCVRSVCWIAFDSFDSALRITAATMQATCWSGEAAIVRSGAWHVLPSRILTSAISAANQILGARRGAIGGRHWAAQSDVRRRSVQQAGASGDSERRPATVGLRLTSEGFVGSSPTAPTRRLTQIEALLESRRKSQTSMPASPAARRVLACGFPSARRRSGSGRSNWSQARRQRGGGVMRPSVLNQRRSRGQGSGAAR